MPRLRLTLRQLQVFAAVAECGSTAAAAPALALSQSATSAALGQLERLLGVQVFDRVGKRLHLNDRGRILLPRAQALLDAAHGLEHLAPGINALRIGASTTIGNHVLPHFLPHLIAPDAQPQVNATGLRVKIGNSEGICAAVAGFALDLGLIEGPVTHPDLHVIPWLRDELILVAPPGFMRHRTRVSRIRLQRALWLLREPGSGTREVTDQHLLPVLGHYRRSVELGSSEAIVAAVAARVGVACLSRWVVANALAQRQLEHVSPPWPPILRQYAIITHRHKHPTPTLEHVLAALRAWPGQRPGAIRV